MGPLCFAVGVTILARQGEREPEIGMATIALVDDDKNILTSVSMLLEQEGYHVRTFSDGAAALTALTATPARLAILDIKMPRMDGLELLRRLRQNADLPVIFLTSKDEEIDELMGLNAGRRRLHPQALLPAPAAGAREGGAAPRRRQQGGRRRPASPRRKRWCAASSRSIPSATNAPGTASPSASL